VSADPSEHAGLPALDPVIHAQPRLRLTVALAALPDGDKVTFPRLQELAGMTAGNLATHLRKLEDAGYIEVTKTYRRRTPVTYLALTRAGRRALEDYTAALQNLLTMPSHNGHAQPTEPGPHPSDQQNSDDTDREISP
jgi:DNA-binding transcriptional ArsR family regulator